MAGDGNDFWGTLVLGYGRSPRAFGPKVHCPRVRRGIVTAVAGLVLAGCGSSGLQGTLDWSGSPDVRANAASGVVANTTGHGVDLNPRAMRLLDADGRKVAGRFRVGDRRLSAHASTPLSVTWRSGKPVRIDYGSGALALPSG